MWVHLDDVEAHRMRVLLDEEFGSDNFIADLTLELNPKGRQLDRFFAQSNDRLLIYAVDKRLVGLDPSSAEEVDLSDFPLRTSDGRPYRLLPLRNTNKKFNKRTRPNLHYPLYADESTGAVRTSHFEGAEPVFPVFGDGGEAVWRWGRPLATERAVELHARMVQGRIGSRLDVFQMDFADQDRTKKFKTVWLAGDIGNTDTARAETKALCGDAFSTPKPERLLERILHIGTEPGDFVLDCFAGSGTTISVAHKMRRRWVGVELLDQTVDKFVVPRLRAVLAAEDPGGVTFRTRRVGISELPSGMSPEEAQQFNTLLGRVSRGIEALEVTTLRALREATKTRDETTVLWEGGGGFTVARMGLSMYEVDDDDGTVYLSPEATNGAWSKAIAGQLKFALTPDDPVFCGVRNRQRLAVIDGVADETVVRTVAERLGEKERAMIVAKGVVPEAAQLLQELAPGSRIKKAPGDVFPKATVK